MTKTRDRSLRAKWLYARAMQLRLSVQAAAEIGVDRGGNAWDMRRLWPTATLWLVDPWRQMDTFTMNAQKTRRDPRHWDKVYDAIVARFGDNPRTKILRMTSAEAVAVVPEDSLDVCYIDADHRYEHVVEDIARWLPKMKRPGFIAGHDFSVRRKPWEKRPDGNNGVKRAVTEHFGNDYELGPRNSWGHILRA